MRRYVRAYVEAVQQLAGSVRDARHTCRWPLRARVARILHIPMNALAWDLADTEDGWNDRSHPLWRLNNYAASGYVRLWSRGKIR